MTKHHIFFALIAAAAVLSGCNDPYTPNYFWGGNPASPRNNATPEPGPILFFSKHLKNGSPTTLPQLYSMDEDGSHIMQLTFDPNFPIFDARWSPDGSEMIVVSDSGGYLIDLATGTRQLLLQPIGWGTEYDEGTQEMHPVWSPDSKQIAYNLQVGADFFGFYDIFVINVDGSNNHQVTDMAGAVLVNDWSPDGSTLLGRSGTQEGFQLAYFDLSGNLLQTWGDSDFASSGAVYSTSGKEIAFESQEGPDGPEAVYVMPARGNNDTLLVASNARYEGYEVIAWSPDDRKILCNGWGPFGTVETFVLLVDRATGSITDITPFEATPAQHDTTYSLAVSWRKEGTANRQR